MGGIFKYQALQDLSSVLTDVANLPHSNVDVNDRCVDFTRMNMSVLADAITCGLSQLTASARMPWNVTLITVLSTRRSLFVDDADHMEHDLLQMTALE